MVKTAAKAEKKKARRPDADAIIDLEDDAAVAAEKDFKTKATQSTRAALVAVEKDLKTKVLQFREMASKLSTTEQEALAKEFFTPREFRALWGRTNTNINKAPEGVRKKYEETQKSKKMPFLLATLFSSGRAEFEERVFEHIMTVERAGKSGQRCEWMSWGEYCQRVGKKQAKSDLKKGKLICQKDAWGDMEVKKVTKYEDNYLKGTETLKATAEGTCEEGEPSRLLDLLMTSNLTEGLGNLLGRANAVPGSVLAIEDGGVEGAGQNEDSNPPKTKGKPGVNYDTVLSGKVAMTEKIKLDVAAQVNACGRSSIAGGLKQKLQEVSGHLDSVKKDLATKKLLHLTKTVRPADLNNLIKNADSILGKAKKLIGASKQLAKQRLD